MERENRCMSVKMAVTYIVGSLLYVNVEHFHGNVPVSGNKQATRHRLIFSFVNTSIYLYLLGIRCEIFFTKNKQFQINIKIVLNSSFHGMKDTRYEGC